MRVTSWVPLGLGAVTFVCGLTLLIGALARRQEQTGRLSRLLRAGAIPAGVPVVVAAVGAAAVIAMATVLTLVAASVTGLLAVTAALATGRRRHR